jgi:NAD+ synthase
MRSLDFVKEIESIKLFIKNMLEEAHFERVIIGLSGGIDSSLVATLCKLALSERNVLGVMMPYKKSDKKSFEHAKLLANFLKIEYLTVPVTDMVDAYFDNYEPEADMLRRGNRMARERMCILYDLSAKHQALVAGTTNKSELYVGYYTQFGDSACAFEPIAHLYKTEVREMAKILNIPEPIIKKAPTADLWDKQTDEDELGITYETLDKILYYHIDAKKDEDFILKQGISENDYDLVMKKIKHSNFKRRMPTSME